MILHEQQTNNKQLSHLKVSANIDRTSCVAIAYELAGLADCTVLAPRIRPLRAVALPEQALPSLRGQRGEALACLALVAHNDLRAQTA